MTKDHVDAICLGKERGKSDRKSIEEQPWKGVTSNVTSILAGHTQNGIAMRDFRWRSATAPCMMYIVWIVDVAAASLADKPK